MSQLNSSRLEDHPDGTGDLNAVHNSNWRKIDAWFNPAFGLTAIQNNGAGTTPGTVITASAAIFTSDDVGATIEYDDHTVATIVSFTSSTVVGAAETQYVASQGFTIFRLTETGKSALARGLCKKVRFLAGDNKKVPRWSNSLGYFVLEDLPGYGLTAGRIPFGAGAAADFTSSANFTWDNALALLAVVGRVKANGYEFTPATLTYAASTAIDFILEEFRTVSLTGDITFTTSNRAAGRRQTLRIAADASIRNFTFPGGWKFLGAAAPASIAASKTALLELWCYGTADTDIVARYTVEP